MPFLEVQTHVTCVACFKALWMCRPGLFNLHCATYFRRFRFVIPEQTNFYIRINEAPGRRQIC